jgi:hypothetical protein
LGTLPTRAERGTETAGDAVTGRGGRHPSGTPAKPAKALFAARCASALVKRAQFAKTVTFDGFS